MLKIEVSVTPENETFIGALLVRVGTALIIGGEVSATDTATETASYVGAVAPKRRGRPAKPDPVSQYVAAGGVIPAAPVEPVAALLAEAMGGQNAYSEVPVEPVAAPVEQVAPVDLDALRAWVRDTANVRGGLWLRPWFIHFNVSKVSELSAEQAQEIRRATDSGKDKP